MKATDKSSDDAKRKVKPIIITGIISSRFELIPPEKLDTLKIDDTYQRDKVELIVSVLSYVLRHGGAVPSPIHIVERRDGARYIVDGQQRWWAHIDAGKAIEAKIYRVDSYATERDLFIILNELSRLGPGTLIHAYGGPSAAIISAAAEDREHPLFHKVNYGIRGLGVSGVGTIGAKVLLMGLQAVTGSPATSKLLVILTTIDKSLASGAARARAEVFLHLVPAIFSNSPPKLVYCKALGVVARERWGLSPSLPKDTVLKAIRSIKWTEVVPDPLLKYQSVFEDAIRKKWPANGEQS